MKKTAICGVWHVHAPEYTRTAKEYTQVIGAWDENKDRLREFCQALNVPAFSSFEELLASEAEGVIVCSSTASHPDLMIPLAKAGKDIFTEKVLAITEEDCDRIAQAVVSSQVNFVISLPQKYTPGQLTVKQLADSGELGRINYVRYHNCHSGSLDPFLPEHFYSKKECGGGAMIDLGAHGMYIIDWLCGVPVTVRSTFTNACADEAVNQMNRDRVEDNAVTVMSFSDGCIAVNETGFVSRHFPITLEVSGEKGMALYDSATVVKRTEATLGRTVPVPMCDPLPSPLVQFLTGKLLEGCGLKEAKALTHLMAEAYRR